MTDLFSYPFIAGAKTGTTSLEAAIMIEKTGRAEVLRKRVYEALKFPMTAKECACEIGQDINSVRPRITELKARCFIKETGGRRNGQHVYRSVM